MNIGRATDVGNVREINEDTIVAEALPPQAANPEGLTAVLLVADGMGGHQAGEVASGLAGEMTRQAFLAAPSISADPAIVGPQALPDSRLAERAIELTRQINQAVFAWGGQGTAHPGTTLTLCLCRARDYTIAHVGDSRAYLLTRSGICQLTDDDSWVGEAVRRGTMTPDEARNSHLRNQLTKSIGIAEDVQPSLYQGAWEPGDVLLLCSDGLSEYVAPEELRNGIISAAGLQAACENLVTLARNRGGHDNISLVAACEGMPHTVSRKPPTWKGEEAWPTPLPGTAAARRVSDPNRALRPMLLTLVGLAFLIIGVAVARWRHSATLSVSPPVMPVKVVPMRVAPKGKNKPAIVPSAPVSEEGAARPPHLQRPQHRRERASAAGQPSLQQNETDTSNAEVGRSGKE